MSTLSYKLPSDRISTNSSIRECSSGSSNRASTGSDLSECTLSPSHENDAWLTLAYAKHRVMVCLMKDVYTRFNSEWRLGFRNRTGSQTASSSTYSRGSSSRKLSSTRSGKRQSRDRGSDSVDANRNKKMKTAFLESEDLANQGRLFACCFHKYNPQKYCYNSETGRKFRSCEGPGFSKISQLK